jgi:hypothetical protein
MSIIYFRDPESEADHLRREGGVQLGREDQPDVHIMEQSSPGKPIMVHQRRTCKMFAYTKMTVATDKLES